MRVTDYARSVRHTFSSNRARAALTLLGIMIGSGTIVLLAGFLKGGQEALLFSSQQANEADLVRVVRDDPPSQQRLKTQRALGLRDADLLSDTRALQGAPVTTESSKESTGYYQRKKKRLRLVSAEPQAISLNRLTVEKGRFLTDDDIRERRAVAVVGQEIWAQLLDEAPSLDGIAINVDGQPWSVVGVLKNKPLMGGGGDGTWMWNRKVLVPRSTYDATIQPGHEAQRIYVRLSLAGTGQLNGKLKSVEQIVNAVVLDRHLGIQNFKVMGEESFANQERLILGVIQTLLLLTGILSLIVGGINIMNIMLVTVTERTREIGIRRAIGASPRQILIQFLLEAAVIALVGGLMGVAGGAFLSWVGAMAMTKVLGNWKLYIELWSIGLGLALSLSVGLLFGFLPAWRASRLDPVEALRYD